MKEVVDFFFFPSLPMKLIGRSGPTKWRPPHGPADVTNLSVRQSVPRTGLVVKETIQVSQDALIISGVVSDPRKMGPAAL